MASHWHKTTIRHMFLYLYVESDIYEYIDSHVIYQCINAILKRTGILYLLCIGISLHNMLLVLVAVNISWLVLLTFDEHFNKVSWISYSQSTLIVISIWNWEVYQANAKVSKAFYAVVFLLGWRRVVPYWNLTT